MAVVKEWRCLAHGPFDGAEGVCPSGCTTVVREFRSAPGGRSDKTRATDAALQRLATRFGYTDISNRKGSVAQSQGKPKMEMKPEWVPMPKGDTLKVADKTIEKRKGSVGGASTAAANARVLHSGGEPTVGAAPLPVEGLPKPRPVVVGREGDYSQDFSKAVSAA